MVKKMSEVNSSQPIMSKEQYEMGMQLLSRYLKSIDVKIVKGTGKVIITWHYDFEDEALARAFAQGFQKTYSGTWGGGR
jgi:hypothetical protein